MKVEQILQSKGADVYAVSDTDTVAQAVRVLNDKNIGAVVVKDNQGRVAGILSERDVVRRLGADGASAMSAPINSCMTCAVETCSPEDTVDTVMGVMTEKRVRHIPVMRDGVMMGLVSIGDVVKRKIEETEQEAAALKEYISS